MQVENLRVEVLGGFSVWLNGQLVMSNVPKLTKPWQLFCYLVLHRDKFVSNRKLISVLWPDDSLSDPANVLKNAVYSLRKELCGGESDTDSPIIYSTGGYRFDPAVELDLDADRFIGLCEAAAEAGEGDERTELYRQAVEAYKGDFLPLLDQDLWVVPLALEYRQRYIACAHGLCEALWRQENCKELLDVASAAVEADPLDDISMIYLFRAMDALKMYRVIVTTYSRMSQHYEDALGTSPPAETRNIFQAASERINKTEQDIIVIKTELTETDQSARPQQRGAYFCNYTNLRHMYGLMKRSAERNNQVLVLALFTLTAAKNATTIQFDLTRTMAEFKVVAMNNLRKADAFARYSRNQYVMLLSVNSLDDGRLVRDRICDSFAHAATSRHMAVDVKLSEI